MPGVGQTDTEGLGSEDNWKTNGIILTFENEQEATGAPRQI